VNIPTLIQSAEIYRTEMLKEIIHQARELRWLGKYSEALEVLKSAPVVSCQEKCLISSERFDVYFTSNAYTRAEDTVSKAVLRASVQSEDTTDDVLSLHLMLRLKRSLIRMITKGKLTHALSLREYVMNMYLSSNVHEILRDERLVCQQIF
jgi:hypothetical protein